MEQEFVIDQNSLLAAFGIINPTEEKIKAALKSWNEKAQEIFPTWEVSYEELTMDFNLRGTTAGYAWYGKNRLQFNLLFAKENMQDFLDETIPHELAHLIAWKLYGKEKDFSAHGWRWQSVFKKLTGKEATRTHSYDTEVIIKNKKSDYFIYTCPKCKAEFKLSQNLHDKAQKGQHRICRTCKVRIKYVKPFDK